MSLIAWFPLNNSTTNLGEETLTMTSLGATSVLNSSGKTARYCYSNSSYSNGGYVSSEKILLGQEHSMACWVKFNSLNSADNLGASLCGQHRYQNYTGMGLTIKYVTSTTGYLSVNTGTGTSRTYNTYCGSTLLQANTWYHVAYTYNGSVIQFYVNGQPDGASGSQYVFSNPEDYFMIGCWSFSGTSGNSVYAGYKLNGYLQDVRAYNHVLSLKEVKNLARGLMVHYDFENLYQPIKAVKFTGAQYIDSGVRSLTASNFEITIDFNRSNTDTADSCLFGQRQFGKFTNIYNGYYESAYGNTAAGTANNTNRHTLVMDEKGIYEDGNVLLTNTIASINSNFPALIGAFSENVQTNAKWFFNGNIYSLKIEDNYSLIRDYIPVIRTSDGEVGLYDKVSNKFYPSESGTQLEGVGVDSSVPISVSVGTNNYFIRDNSGNNIHSKSVNVTNTTASSDVRIGTTSAKFSGNGYLRNQNFSLKDSFTLSTWVKTSSTNTQCLFCCRGGTGTGPALFLINGSGGTIRFDTSDTSCTASYPNDGEWHHIVCVFYASSQVRRIYLDGVLKMITAGSSLGTTTGVLSIGASYPSSASTTPNGNYLNGYLADWRIYSTALTQDEISELFCVRAMVGRYISSDRSNGILYCNGYSTKNNVGQKFCLSGTGVGSGKIIYTGKLYLSKYEKIDYVGTPSKITFPFSYLGTYYFEMRAKFSSSLDTASGGRTKNIFSIVDKNLSLGSGVRFYYDISDHKLHFDKYEFVDPFTQEWVTKWTIDSLDINEIHTFSYEQVDGKLKCVFDGVTYYVNGSIDWGANDFYILCDAGTNHLIYYLTIFDKGLNQALYDCIPLRVVQDDGKGLYNKVDNTFTLIMPYSHITTPEKTFKNFSVMYQDGGASVAVKELNEKYSLTTLTGTALTGITRLTVYYMDEFGYAKNFIVRSGVPEYTETVDVPLNSYYEWRAVPASGYTMASTTGSGYIGGPITVLPLATVIPTLAAPSFRIGYTDRFDNQYDIAVEITNPSSNPTVECEVEFLLWTSTDTYDSESLSVTLTPGETYFDVIMQNQYPIDTSYYVTYEATCDISAQGYNSNSSYISDSTDDFPNF